MKTLYWVLKKCVIYGSEIWRYKSLTRGLGRLLSVMGGARLQEGTPLYCDIVRISRMVAESGWSLMTGAGPGVMQAANEGAFNGGGLSVGCKIKLPFEAKSNPYLHRVFESNHFNFRKKFLFAAADVVLFCPGGYGTLDEYYELMTLVQCGKQKKPIKVILYDSEFWGPVVKFHRDTLYRKYQTISEPDLFICKIVDTPEEAVSAILGQEASNAVLLPGLLSNLKAA